MSWRSGDVWADAEEIAGNKIRQLLVAEGEFRLKDTGDAVHGPTGTHLAVRVGHPAPSALHARIPLAAQNGQPPRGARWEGPRRRIAPDEVLTSYVGAMTLRTESDGVAGLRRPQIGAIHAVLAYLTTGRTQPCTVVMPTGTGKTETMLALLVAAQPTKLLVIVPSDALRAQVAGKFERLGILHTTGIVLATALRPVVGLLAHSFADVGEASAFLANCNVVVATPSVITACAPDVRAHFMNGFTHLFVDEAHHIAARTWKDIRDAFEGRTVVQFTATPFRTDNKHVGGEIVYSFPLREAQKDGYFANIKFRSIVDLVDEDQALADAAVQALRADLEAGLDHLMMVRTSSVKRAIELLEQYRTRAPELAPVLLHSQLKPTLRDAARAALDDRTTRIVVCVNMLGEGFDLPALKIAAIHDTQKSLGVTLQFIGRFTRVATDQNLGDATVLVARGDTARDPRLRALYAEDSDWNSVVRDLSDEAVEGQRAITEFEAGFTSLPDEVTLRNLQPKMSTVVYRTPTDSWDPLALADFFGEERLLTEPIGLNLGVGVAWCVVQHVRPVRWGDIRTVNDTTHELFVLYFDATRRLLYINSSDNDGVFEDLAEATAGATSYFSGPIVYRVMGNLQRLIPTNVGLLDARSAFRRFSMLVGSDVRTGFTEAEASSKTQTHIAVSGFEAGEKINISASLKGRIWSPQTASTLKSWVDWCDGVGTKLLDDSITLDAIIASFLWPQVLSERPEGVLLAAEWPWADIDTLNENITVGPPRGPHVPIRDVELASGDLSTTGPFRVVVRSEHWQAIYAATIVDSQVQYSRLDGPELHLQTRRQDHLLRNWLDANGLTLLLEGDRVINSNGLLLDMSSAAQPYNPDRLISQDWAGTDLHCESRGSGNRQDSIQAHILRDLASEDWDVLLDDDGPGEAADIVAIRIDEGILTVRLVHCKYAGGEPGARVADLYEVCGQAQKSARWRDHDVQPLFDHLAGRAKKSRVRTGRTPFEVGDLSTLHRLQDEARLLPKRFEIVVVQPGLSCARVSAPQLQLLGATALYVRQMADADLTVVCSS